MTDRFGRRLQPSLTLSLTPIAAACAALFAWTPASAQTSNEDTAQAGAPVQTVVVTGIRRGIEEAISVKKNAESIVEAISAEDIGKLPDASIAESIARLPGVTAQRFKGRAQAVSIRGMSPDFSTALLNGREQVSTGDSRGVEFDQYPAELLAGVVIYKTPDAALVGQGLSGTTDMQTVRPLDFGQRTVALNARAVRSGLGTEEHGNGSRFSASYIDQFAGRTVGLALGYARLNDTPHTSRFVSWGAGTAQYQGKTVDVPYNGIEAWSGTDDDKRDGVMAVLQVRPSRDFNSTLDLFYSRYDHRGTDHGLLFPLNDSYVPRSSLTDQPGALIRAELDGNRVVAGTFDNVRGVVQNRGEYAVEKTKSVGWKSTARFSPDWTGSLDLSYNKATRTDSRAESYAGAYGAGGTAALDEVTFSTRDFGFGAHLNYADPSIMRLSDVLGWGGSDIQAAYLRNSEVSDRIKAVRLSARRTLGDGLPFSDVEAGVNVSDRSKQRGFMEFLGRIKGGGNDRAAALPMPDPQVGPAGESGLSILYFDPYAVGQRVFDYTEKRDPYIYNKDWTVREKVDTAYVRANIGTEVAGIGVHGNVGLQVIRTDQSSQALSVDQNGGTSDRDRPVHAVEAGTTYTDVLPSLNLGFDLGSQQTVRFALAKVMARPTLSDMRASNQFSVDRTRNIYTGSGGNPGLSPFRAKAIDLSYEKYFGNKGYVSAAWFFKRLDTYVISVTDANFDFTPYRSASNVSLPSNIGEFTRPTNGQGGHLKGIELAASLPLNVVASWLDGFGVQANYAYTDSSVSLPNNAEGGSGDMPLPGLSKATGALTAYYEKNGFSVRLAQRYRSKFIGEVLNVGGDRQNTYIKGERVVDLQLGYDVERGWLKGVSLLVQMNNLTNAEVVRYRKVESNIIEHSKYGRTVLAGVNYKF